MKYILTVIFALLAGCSQVNELTISYDVLPELYIGSHDYHTLTIKPSGEATWIIDLPSPPIVDGEVDWKAFHENSADSMHEIKYSAEHYQNIYNIIRKLIKTTELTNKQLSGPGFTSFNITMWGTPSVNLTYSSIGGKDFPEAVYELNEYVKSLPMPNKSKHAEL